MKPSGPFSGAGIAERASAVAAIASQHAIDVDTAGRFPAEAVESLRAQRLMGVAAPTARGGEGLGLAAIASICTELGAACASTGMVFAMHQINMLNLVDCAEDSAWHGELISRAVSEQLLFASATTEAGVGGDLRHSMCAIEHTGEQFTLDKAATVISYGEQADVIFVTARRDSAAPSSDQVLAVVERDQVAMDPISKWDALGMRGTCSHGWQIRAHAPVKQIMPKSFADIAADSMVSISHLLWASVWFGIALDALGRAQAFVSAEARRKPGQTPLGTIRLAEAYSMLRSIENELGRAIDLCSQLRANPGSLSLSVSMALNALKTSVSTNALHIVDEAMMICGLNGYRNDTPFSLGRHLRDIHSARLMISNDRILANTGSMMLVQRPSFFRKYDNGRDPSFS